MNPQITAIPAADLPKLKYAIWQQLTNDWSPPMSFQDAQEFAARDPELHACAILPSGEYTDPAPFAEIYKRANAPRDLETAAALRQRATAIHAQRAAANAPDTSTTRAARIFIVWFIASLYASGAGLLIIGIPGTLQNGNTISITFTILGGLILTAAICAHRYAKK